MCAICQTLAANDAGINGLFCGTQWAGNTLTFSFPSSNSTYGSYYAQGEQKSFTAFTASQQSATLKILDMYSSFADLTFVKVTESATVQADLRFGQSTMPTTAWAYYPSTGDAGGDVWLGTSRNYYTNPAKGNYAFYTIAHEIGHALGLKHPHDSGGYGIMPLDVDQIEYTVMSYRSYEGADVTKPLTIEQWGYPQSLMMYDIAAIQNMYGAKYAITTDTTYSWNPSTGEEYINGVGQGAPGANRILMTIWAGHTAGHVTYDFSNYSTNLNVDLQPGAWTTTSSSQLSYLGAGHYADGNIANALLYHGDTRSLVENAKGGNGNDTIVGNAIDNVIYGGAGSDKLYGLDGNDTFYGGAGNDYIDGGYGNDTAVFSGTRSNYKVTHNGDGSWTVVDLRSGSPDGMDTLKGIEVLDFSDQNVTIAAPEVPPVVTSGGTGTVDPALLQSVQSAAVAILRTTLSTDQAQSDAGKLASGMTMGAYLAQLVEKAQDSTIPAVIVYDFVFGTTPDSAHLNALAPFVNTQIFSPGYQATNDPRLGGYEAMGLGLATTPQFSSLFSQGADSSFITSAYNTAFGRAPLAAQVDHFLDQIHYFEGLYVSAGIDSPTASIDARGAVLGQIIGIAASEANNHLALAAENYLVAVANGTASYGSPLLGSPSSANFADMHLI